MLTIKTLRMDGRLDPVGISHLFSSIFPSKVKSFVDVSFWEMNASCIKKNMSGI